MVTRWVGSLVLLMLSAGSTGCSMAWTSTPGQAAALKTAQSFSDEVTGAYGVRRVRVITEGSHYAGFIMYYPQAEWISVSRVSLERGDVRLTILRPLAWATLPLPPQSGPAPDSKQPELRFAINRRSVEILGKFLGWSEREAIDWLANGLVARSKVYERDRKAG